MEQEIIRKEEQEAVSGQDEKSSAIQNESIPEDAIESSSSENKSAQIKPRKRAAKKEDGSKTTKKAKVDGKRIPNIAEELAKNRNNVRGASPTSLTASLSAPVAVTPAVLAAVKSDPENQSLESVDLLMRKETNPRRTQVKISSLLSPNGDNNIPPPPQTSSEMEFPPITHGSLPIQVPSLPNTPKVILPTQLPGSGPPDANDSSSETPGVLIARISSPVSVLPQTQLKRSTSSVAGGSKTPAEKAQKSNTIGAVPSRGRQNKSNAEPKKRNTPKTAVKRENSIGGAKKDQLSVNAKKGSSAANKKDNTSNPAKKDGSVGTVEKEVISKGSSTAVMTKEDSSPAVKKENSTSGVKRENSTLGTFKAGDKDEKKESKSTSKSSGKKDHAASNGTSTNNSKNNDAKKKPVKKETTPAVKTAKTPKKLIVAPPIKSPSLLEVLERGKTQEEPEEPALIVEVPLYSAENNEYLDENGQVVFNFYKIVQDKFSSENGTNLTDLKAAKRNLFGQINGGQMDGAAEEDDDGLEEVEDDGEEEDDEDGEEAKQNASPKKKSHPNKGKSLIGKYDTEDPFIDDTELLWEEQRAATKDGFFVYFGPLIEKGHYASLERADGTMKRGGVKNK